MNQFYIYSHNYTVKDENDENVITSSTVIFCENDHNFVLNLQSQLKIYYETHPQTDTVLVFGGEYLNRSMVKAFEEQIDDTYRHIPPSNLENLKTNTFVFSFDENGNLKNILGDWKLNNACFPDMFNEGLAGIFLNRGGLITSRPGYHYVFPSGKHCDKFLRTGNILLHSSEVFFIAFHLLASFSPGKHLQIVCDTSSINSLAFVLQELKRRLITHKSGDFKMVPVESFSSYEGLVNGTGKRLENSLVLISASTSGNILERILNSHVMVYEENLKILFFLGPGKVHNQIKSRVLCNLTKSPKFPGGVELYSTFTETNCEYCTSGSHASKINGDVFLPEEPKINRIVFTVHDAPTGLNNFVRQFGSKEKVNEHFFKVNFKEGTSQDLQYEIYFNFYHVINAIRKNQNRYSDFKQKLDDYINQYIPSNTRYLICLPDDGSTVLAEYILDIIRPNYNTEMLPEILAFDNIDQMNDEKAGAVTIIASCISNGKNLLYLSRALRKFEKLKIIYFVGIARTTTEAILDFLMRNLKQGKYGKDTNSFYAVEKFYCNNEVQNTTWLNEIQFLKSFAYYMEEQALDETVLKLVKDRIQLIENSMSDREKGLANGLFYNSLFNNDSLKIRKNYAFLSYKDYHDNVSQADIYFTVLSIFNHLRHTDQPKNLRQSEYLRNLIDPNNFNRFNDGLIQACILRASKTNELCYHIDDSLSLEMKGILETIILHQKTEQGEALLEFLYALASKKMTMKRQHLLFICELVLNNVKNTLAQTFALYIRDVE